MIINFFDTLFENWSMGHTVFAFALVGTILVVLYAITLIHNKLRLIESELQALRKDQSVMSEELEVIATAARRINEKL